MATITKGTISKGVVSKANISVSESLVLDDRTSVITSAGSVNVNENISTSTTAYTATARDSAGSTSGFSFAISTGDSNDLNINSSSGAVTFKASPDFETKTSYTFIVTATKSGQLTATKSVTIGINDVFDTGLLATGTLGRYSPTSGLYFHGYEDSQSLPGTANSHRGTLSPLSNSAFYGGAIVKELGYGKSQYSSAVGTEFKIAIAGDTRSQSGFKLVFTDKNNVSRTFRTTDSNMYSESYNSFGGQTSYNWDVTDSDAQAVNVFSTFLGITGMSVGTSYTVVNVPYPAHQSGSPGQGSNSSSARGQALISIGTVASSSGFFGGARVIANGAINDPTNITNTQDIEFSNGLVSDMNRGAPNGTGDTFTITLEEL